MKSFCRCIWLTWSEKEKNNNIWNQYTNGIQSHITIKYNVDLDSADYAKNKNKNKNKKYKIKLSEELFYGEEEGFFCLYKKSSLCLCEEEKRADWFPSDAYVSFYYSYEPISRDIFEITKKKLENKNIGIFDCFQIKLCDDHFLLW